MINTNVSMSNKIVSTSQGSQEKFCKNDYWYKLDYFGGEGEVEYFVSEILKCSTLKENEFVNYSKCLIKAPLDGNSRLIREITGCKSRSFLSDNETEISFYDAHKWSDAEPTTYRQFFNSSIKYFNKHYGLDILPYLQKVYTLDALTHNTDRHLNNLSIIKNVETSICRLAPIFDNGCAFGVQMPNYSKRPLKEYFITLCPKIFFKEGFYKPIDILGLGFRLYEEELSNLLSKINVDKRYIDLFNISLKLMLEQYPDFIIPKSTQHSKFFIT